MHTSNSIFNIINIHVLLLFGLIQICYEYKHKSYNKNEMPIEEFSNYKTHV